MPEYMTPREPQVPEKRFCVIIEHPNETVALFFDDSDNARAADSFRDMFAALKGSPERLEERTAEYASILEKMGAEEKTVPF